MLSLYENSSEIKLEDLLEGQAPFVSIYLPTSRDMQELKKDKLVLKNLIRDAEKFLSETYDKRSYQGLLAEMEGLLEDPGESIWLLPKDGLAILACPGAISAIKLSYSVDEKVIVADSFHIKPLIRGLQYESCYYLLSLSKDRYDLYRGDAVDLEPVVLPEGFKNEFSLIYDDFDSQSNLNTGPLGGPEAGYHGNKTKSDEDEKDREKFFRHVNKEVSTIVEPHATVPLILVTLKRHQSEFRDISDLSNLIDEGIEKPIESLSEKQLKDEARTIVEREQKKRVEALIARFGDERAVGRASADLREIAQALIERKVETIFIEEGFTLPGTYDRMTGSVMIGDSDTSDLDDITDDFAQETLLQGGSVLVIPSETMPGEGGAAALFRY